MDTEESTSVMDDYETLISSTAQRQEKSAPEILQFKASLVQRIKEHIELAQVLVFCYGVSGEYVEVDLLVGFEMLIEKYLFYILKTDEYLNQFSKQEQMFARRCTDDLGRHLDDTVLAKLPNNYQSTLKQSITSEEDDVGTQFFSKSFLHLF
ncbi:hypothetical protein NC651_024811 [Populus alba x Populus x berolinensis]|nr:hypothetical protein NC651_024811 [Populus alba x Populus x berolinensis]